MSFYAAFAEYYEAIFPFDATVYTLLRRYIAPEHHRCLDVGCGTGHYCGRLAADGFEAVGIDLDPAMIAQARRRYPQATFHVLNMLDIAALLSTTQTGAVEKSGRFEAAFCIGNTAAHLAPAQFAQFLDALRDVLQPNAPWILQVMNWDYVLERETFVFPIIETSQGLTFHRTYRLVSEAQVMFHTRLQAGAEIIFEDVTPLYPLRAAEIARLHRERGFVSLAHFGNYAGAPFDPQVFSANIFVFRTADRHFSTDCIG
ncbi:MAG TPA: class I SAM-dependent methyltransferase [Anaerolineae bacterium]|nr:class I SAM-dependent methyltransferase [Anaerolineae bacterium]HQK12588.1 class I SAM-dependent methyltransferase [Anaerolineae bacterium]